jgi:rubrerythrin
MKDLLQRRDELKRTLADETAKFQEEAEARLEKLVDDEHAHRAEFEKALKNGERPADSVWPQPGVTTEPAPQ